MSLQADLFMAGGSINTGRNKATATLLPNGKVLLTGGYNLNAGGFIAAAELYDPATGNWTTINPMITARYQHTATSLPNGQLLVAGGQGNAGTLNNAELYNPTTGNWTATPNMPAARQEHTATLLPSGKVLVVAGLLGSFPTATASVYDPVNNTWTATTPIPVARYGHTATLLGNGKVLVAGGFYNTYLNTAYLYDYTGATWTATPTMVGARYLSAAALLPNGNVLVSGGWNGTVYLASAEIYNPTAGTWTATTSMSQARFGHTSTPLGNGRILIVAGFGPGGPNGYQQLGSAELYDWITGWSSAASIPTPREGHSTTPLGDGRVMIVAGVRNISPPFVMDASIYVPSVSTWKLTQQMSVPREYHSANLLPDGKVLAVGGWSSSGPTASAELYNHTTGQWETTTAMSGPRYYHTATTMPYLGWTLVAGGYDNSGLLASAAVYKPTKPTPPEAASWMQTPPMSTARYLHTATLLPYNFYNKVLIVGGCGTSGSPLSSAEIFDLSGGMSGGWSPAGNMTSARQSHTATWLQSGKVLAAGGVGSGGAILATAEMYDPNATWSPAGTMPNGGRYFHAATLLANGKVLVTGGLGPGSTILSTALIYDPAGAGSWSTTASMLTARYYHTAVLLPDGKVLVAGGLCGGNNTPCAEIYDPTGSGSWTPTGALNNGRYDHTATLLPNGKVLVAGGAPSSYMPIASAEIYAPILVNPTNSGGRPVTSLYYASTGPQYFPRYVNFTGDYAIGRRLNLSSFMSSLPASGWPFGIDSVPVNGVLRVPSGTGPFPLAVFAHGKSDDSFTGSEEGYNYLLNLLASWGVIAASIDANCLNGAVCMGGGSCPDMDARAILHLEHVRQFKLWNETAGHPLYGKIDLNNIMIVGHSRGAEGATHASVFNALTSIVPEPGQPAVPLNGSVGLGPYGFTLKAVVAIAPTDRYVPVAGVSKVKHNLFVMHSSRDCDIYAFEGYKIYDRAHPIDLSNPTQDANGFKALLWLVGGNHAYFHETWSSDACTALLLDRPQQQQIAKVFISALAQGTLLNRAEYLEIFKDNALAKDWLPAGKDVISQYQDPKRRFINHYEEDANQNTLSPPNMGANSASLAYNEGDFTWWEPMNQETHGVVFSWPNASHFYESTITAGLNASSYKYLALRIGQGSEANNPVDQLQNFSIVVFDASGASASFASAGFARLLYPDAGKSGLRKIVMQTVRVPLTLFQGRNINLNNISKVRLTFDQTATGTVYFDEVQLSQ